MASFIIILLTPRLSGSERPAGSSSKLHLPSVLSVLCPWVSKAQSHFHLTSLVHTSVSVPLREELKIKPSLQLLQVNTSSLKIAPLPQVSLWSQAGPRDGTWRGCCHSQVGPRPSVHVTPPGLRASGPEGNQVPLIVSSLFSVSPATSPSHHTTLRAPPPALYSPHSRWSELSHM